MEKWFSERRFWLFGNRLPLLPRRSRGPSRAMERYEKICKIGEGSYGVVFKCRCRETGELVAIKKYVDSEDDPVIRKIALREIRMLKNLRHPNLVNLIEVFRRKRRLHLVFEYCERTVLDEVEAHPHGAPEEVAQMIAWQTLVGLNYIHSRHCVHRDIKPENLLLTSNGLLKLCDFGFARSMSSPNGEMTEYVATRWYRAPELLCAMTNYGPAVDIWAVGCVYAELLRSAALWPGNTDMDQLFLIQKTLGDLTPEQMQALRISESPTRKYHSPTITKEPLEKMLPKNLSPQGFEFLTKCFEKNPARRYTAEQLLKLPYFSNFHTSEISSFTGDYELGNTARPKNIPSLPQIPNNSIIVVTQGLGQSVSPAKRGRSKGDDRNSHLPSL
ncbi:cyclin-dependent kinase-like 1 [Hetaerina americana]|uniref:cyclin-dependent kinase-like 1 n=1 Tax=Hetaerina americana TaxID=62018 RepID=UPI003A7F610D